MIFKIKIFLEYLQELNSTGSFSDESEKIPMCFIECYLSKLGIFGADAQINKERTANMYELEDDEMVDDCNNEMRKLKKSLQNILN